MRLTLLIKGMPFSVLLRGLPSFVQDFRLLKKQMRESKATFPLGKLYPCVEDRYKEIGTASGHYFHQDLLVAGKIFKNGPQRHVDIGSRLDGFIAHVASFREIEVLDIRNLDITIRNVRFKQADLMDKGFNLPDYCDSVSCLHALEHFGLGRYGDTIDYDGYLTGWKNIHRMLKKNGKLYFSVPMGEQRIEFNAHRVFSIGYLLDIIGQLYRIDSFSYVDDKGKLVEDSPLTEENTANNFSCRYGLAIFELTKN